jgi:hypothetical protein
MKKIKKIILPSLFVILIQLIVLTCHTPTETNAVNNSIAIDSTLKLLSYTPPANQSSPYIIAVPKPPVYVSAWSRSSNTSTQYGSGGISSMKALENANIQYNHSTGKLTVYANPIPDYYGQLTIYVVYFE